MEGVWLRNILGQLCIEDKLDHAATERIVNHASGLNEIIDGLGFCLSEEGDILSQWRGYAANATGISVGFSKEYFEAHSSEKWRLQESGYTIVKVEYDPKNQADLIKPIFQKIKTFIESGALSSGLSILGSAGLTEEEIQKKEQTRKRAFEGLLETMLHFLPHLFQLKNPAFSEEREWRLVSYLAKNGNDSCSFRAVADRLIPYREFPLQQLVTPSIKEVVLGPKHITRPDVISSFLKTNGFADVKVRRSEATYR